MSALLDLLERAYAVVSWGLPREFRDELGGELADVFHQALRDRYREAGLAAAVTFAARESAQLLLLVCRERCDYRTSDWSLNVTPAALRQDLLLTVRGLFRAPAFCAVAVVTLAIGLAVNIVTFSLLNAIRHPVLPYIEPERLVAVSEAYAPNGWTQNPTSLATAIAVASEANTFDRVGFYSQRRVSLADAGTPVRLAAAVVSSSLWTTLGVAPVLGREFVAAEDGPGGAAAVIISDSLWRGRFGGDPAALGSRVTVDGVPRTIVGVMPPGLRYPEAEDLWLPLGSVLAADPLAAQQRDARAWGMVARLRPGTSIVQARAELRGISARAADAYPLSNAGWRLEAIAVPDETFAATGAFFGALQGVGALLVLIMCANVGNLLLARGERRRRELAIRASLGASRGRLTLLLMLEAILLSTAAAVLALIAAGWLVQFVPGAVSEAIPFYVRFRIDAAVVLFAFAAAASTAVVAGLASALRVTRHDPFPLLTRSASSLVAAPHAGRLRALLLFGQTAVAGALMTSTLVLGFGLMRLQHIDLGFEPHNTLSAEVPLPSASYGATPAVAAFVDRLLERLRATAGVEAAAVSAALPAVRPSGSAGAVEDARASGDIGLDSYASVSPDYFAAAGIRVVAGRAFVETDRAGAERVAIVNEEAARRLFGTESALGRRLRFGRTSDDRPVRVIVGVVRNTTLQPLDPEIDPRLYVPFAQDPGRQITLTLRTHGAPERLAHAVSEAVSSVDATLAIDAPLSGDQRLAAAVWPVRFFNTFATISSVFGVLIAGAGVYGLTRYLAIARTREIGLRMALGADVPAVIGMIVRQTGIPIAAGLGCGLAGSIAISQLLATVVLGVKPFDASALSLAAAVLLFAAAAAVGFPALRAARISPVDALRSE